MYFAYYTRFIKKYCLVITYSLCILTIIYNEFLVYHHQAVTWPVIPCQTDSGNCTRILFVSEPHILNYLTDSRWFQTISKWYSHRYLKMTYSVALDKFEPDVVVFLGHLLDLTLNLNYLKEFKRNVELFRNVFPNERRAVYVYSHREKSFGQAAFNSNPRRHNQLEFAHIEVDKFDRLSQNSTYLLFTYSLRNMCPFLAETRIPNAIIFYSYNYSSLLKICTGDHTEEVAEVTGNHVYTLDVTQLIAVSVPSCSYRMGGSHVGYGAAVFHSNDHIVKYSVIWSPPRHTTMRIYLGFAFVILALIGFRYLKKKKYL